MIQWSSIFNAAFSYFALLPGKDLQDDIKAPGTCWSSKHMDVCCIHASLTSHHQALFPKGFRTDEPRSWSRVSTTFFINVLSAKISESFTYSPISNTIGIDFCSSLWCCQVTVGHYLEIQPQEIQGYLLSHIRPQTVIFWVFVYFR